MTSNFTVKYIKSVCGSNEYCNSCLIYCHKGDKVKHKKLYTLLPLVKMRKSRLLSIYSTLNIIGFISLDMAYSKAYHIIKYMHP